MCPSKASQAFTVRVCHTAWHSKNAKVYQTPTHCVGLRGPLNVHTASGRNANNASLPFMRDSDFCPLKNTIYVKEQKVTIDWNVDNNRLEQQLLSW